MLEMDSVESVAAVQVAVALEAVEPHRLGNIPVNIHIEAIIRKMQQDLRNY